VWKIPSRTRRATIASFAGALLGVVAVALPQLATPAAAAVSIQSEGPLTQINISNTLNCDVRHEDDDRPEWYGTNACGTFFTDHTTLWGPQDLPAGSNASPRTTYTHVSSNLVGNGSVGSPFVGTTVVTLPGSDLTITQRDTYLVGREDYRTDVTISNAGGSAVSGIVYTAGDCFLGDSDTGYGRVQGTSAVCTTSSDIGGRIEALVPITGGNNWQEAVYSDIWRVIGQRAHFNNTIRAGGGLHDNGVGLSWDATVPAGGSTTFSWSTVFSPAGITPLTMRVDAEHDTSPRGTLNGYKVSICNFNVENFTLTSVTLTLPDSFTWRSIALAGIFTTEPTVEGNTATWTGERVIPGPGGCGEFHFAVDVGNVLGTFTVDAEATAIGNEVSPVTDDAPITVVIADEEQVDLSVAKTASPSPVVAGTPLTYRVTVTNNSEFPSEGFTLSDIVPVGSTLVRNRTDPRCSTVEPTDAGFRLICRDTQLAAGASTEFTIMVDTDGSLATGSVLVNAALVELDEPFVDPDPDNNVASVATEVVHRVDVRISMAFDPGLVFEGQSSTLLVTVKNDGPSTATNVTLRVTVPDGLTLRMPSKGAPDCTIDGGKTMTCNFPAIVAGDPTFGFPVDTGPGSGAAPPAVHTASGTVSAADDVNPSNNDATAQLLVAILPITGNNIWPVAGSGVGALLLGIVLVVAAVRRTRRADEED
jgi:uncharacterized repeat protein (TIGR01451 family)